MSVEVENTRARNMRLRKQAKKDQQQISIKLCRFFKLPTAEEIAVQYAHCPIKTHNEFPSERRY